MSTLIFTALLAVGLGFLARTLYRRFAVLLKVTPVPRFDRIPERLNAVAQYVLGQKKFVVGEQPLPGDKAAGWMHFFIFWGFTILAVQVVHMFARGFFPDFHLPGLSVHLLGGPYLLLKDLIQIIVLGAIGMALYRWIVSHPARLYGYAPAENRLRSQSHGEALLILLLIGGIMISGYLYDGGHLYSAPSTPEVDAERAWQPFSALTGFILFSIGGAGLAGFASNFGWWAHNCIILSFLNLLPLSKHFHIITSVPNVFFKKLEPVGQLSKQDLENATPSARRTSTSSFGSRCSMYSCTECGRCSRTVRQP
jgi:hypothetical protein